jgi:hypothetical protein
MKKLLLAITVFFGTAAAVSAQCSPDPQYTSPGVYPDSATNFSNACVGEPYSQLITNVVPADTTVQLIPGFPVTLPIDSIVVTNVQGLPPGMNFACNPAGCAYPGGTTGCAVISGVCNTPGTYNLIIDLSAYVGGVATPNNFTLTYYRIIVDPQPCSANVLQLAGDELFSLYPNPAGTSFNVKGLANVAAERVVVYNMEGKAVLETAFNGQDIFIAHLNSGLYYVNIHSANAVQTVKLVKE